MTRANRAQACVIFALSRNEFDRLVGEGLPAEKSSRSRGEDWSVDLAAAHRWLIARALADAGFAASGEALDLEQQRARLAKEQADKASMENRHRRGELLEAADVRAAIIRYTNAANQRLGAYPSRWAAVVNPADPTLARRHLELGVEEIRVELRGLAGEMGDDDADAA